MGKLHEVIREIHHQVTKNDFDEVLCISGDEGVGKSNLGLWLVEFWLQLNGEEVTREKARECIGMDALGFAKVLKGAKKYGVVMADEAADISSRTALNKQNVAIMKAYQIIRGENIFTIMIIPSIFDLDPFFRKRRVRHLIHVSGRGKFGFWNTKRLRAMVAVNDRMVIKDPMVIGPLFRESFPKYTGVMLEEYKAMKIEKMAGIREKLLKDLSPEKEDKKPRYNPDNGEYNHPEGHNSGEEEEAGNDRYYKTAPYNHALYTSLIKKANEQHGPQYKHKPSD